MVVICCTIHEGGKHLCELPDGPKTPLKGGVPAAVITVAVTSDYSLWLLSCLSEMSDDTKFYPACFPDREQNGGWPKRPFFRTYFLLQTEREIFLGAASRLWYVVFIGGTRGSWPLSVACACRWVTVMTSVWFIPSCCSSPCPSGLVLLPLMDKFLLSSRGWGSDSLWFHSRM